ncbi:glycerophosphodiester phosphodiesterase family protein [Brachybacterium sp. YJGR34]|uniref:glycerophosphodiester phosphodiesterase n=1 Tax=Brachybacterium sp. YJGR34 TaxID=2059911 RepID=UPI000E0AAC90|nr:glycerophosphodiester phosphodiesterase family protein [Brachybacterium sp. YJGR34]
MTPRIVAHRGNSSVAPENTLAALVSAARADAHMIEIDLQMTTDGVGVVFHDHPLGRTAAGTGLLRDLDSAAVAGLDVGSWFDPAFAGTAVPLLPEVLELLRRYESLGLLLEVSGPWKADALARELATISDAGLAERVIVQSFALESLEISRDVAPSLQLGYLSATWGDSVMESCAQVDAQWCNVNWDVIGENPDVVEANRERGLRTMAWTVNEPEKWAAAIDAGVDGIITDRPDRLRGWLAARR